MECLRCGTCCVAPDISTLGKEVGVPCPHLGASLGCSIYEERPAVCRGYRPDQICRAIAAPTLPERVRRYLALFDLSSGSSPAKIPRPATARRKTG